MDIILKTVGGRTASLTHPTSFAALCAAVAEAFSFDPKSVKLFVNGTRMTQFNYGSMLAQLSGEEPMPSPRTAVASPVGYAGITNRKLQSSNSTDAPTDHVLAIGKVSAVQRRRSQNGAAGQPERNGNSPQGKTSNQKNGAAEDKNQRDGTSSSPTIGASPVAQSSSKSQASTTKDSSDVNAKPVLPSSRTKGALRHPSDGSVGRIISAKGSVDHANAAISKSRSDNFPLPWPHSPDGLREVYALLVESDGTSEHNGETDLWHPTLEAMVKYVEGKEEKLKLLMAQIQRVVPNLLLWIKKHIDQFVAIFNSTAHVLSTIHEDDVQGTIIDTVDEDGEEGFIILYENEDGKEVMLLPPGWNAEDEDEYGSDDIANSSSEYSSSPDLLVNQFLEIGLPSLLEELGFSLLENDGVLELLFQNAGGWANDSDEEGEEGEDIAVSELDEAEAPAVPEGKRAVPTGTHRKRSADGSKGKETLDATSVPGAIHEKLLTPLMEELHEQWANECLVTPESATRMGEMLTTLSSVRERFRSLSSEAARKIVFDIYIAQLIISETKLAVEEQLGTLPKDSPIPLYAVNRKRRLEVCLPWITSDGHRRLAAALHQYAQEEGTTLVMYSVNKDRQVDAKDTGRVPEKADSSSVAGAPSTAASKVGVPESSSAKEDAAGAMHSPIGETKGTRTSLPSDTRRTGPSPLSPAPGWTTQSAMAFVVSGTSDDVQVSPLRSLAGDMRKSMAALDSAIKEVTSQKNEASRSEHIEMWSKLMKLYFQLYVAPIVAHLPPSVDRSAPSSTATSAPPRETAHQVCFMGLGGPFTPLPMACLIDDTGARLGSRWPVFQSQSPLDILFAARQPWSRSSVASAEGHSSYIVNRGTVPWLSPALLKDMRGKLVNPATVAAHGVNPSHSLSASSSKELSKQFASIVHVEGATHSLEATESANLPVVVPFSELLVVAGVSNGGEDCSMRAADITQYTVHRAALWPCMRSGTHHLHAISAAYELTRTFYTVLRGGASLAYAIQRAQEETERVHGKDAPWAAAALTLLHYGGHLRSLEMQPVADNSMTPLHTAARRHDDIGDIPPLETSELDTSTAVAAAEAAEQMRLPHPPAGPKSTEGGRSRPSATLLSEARGRKPAVLAPSPPTTASPQGSRRVGSGYSRHQRIATETAEARYVVSHGVDEAYETMLRRLLEVLPGTDEGVLDTLIASLEDNKEQLNAAIAKRQREDSESASSEATKGLPAGGGLPSTKATSHDSKPEK